MSVYLSAHRGVSSHCVVAQAPLWREWSPHQTQSLLRTRLCL